MNPEDLCVNCMKAKGRAQVCPSCEWCEGAEPGSLVHLRPRTELMGKYLLGTALGHGGFGITYLAWDLNLEQKLAVKEYFPEAVATRGADGRTVKPRSDKYREEYQIGLTKFIEEGRILAQFRDHAGIVSQLDFLRANGSAYIVMRYVEGITLEQHLTRNQSVLPFDLALRTLLPVMDALRAVHKAGLLHRDIKPGNIYITAANDDHGSQVKLLDFGSAKQAMSEHSRSLQITHTAGYSPEEQYRTAGQQGPWTDVYAFGATMYRAITGQPPPEALQRMVDDELKPPNQLGITIPPHAEAALMKALAVRGPDRFPTIADLQEALISNSGQTAVPITANTLSKSKSKSRAVPWRTSVIVAAAILLLLVVTSLAWRASRPDPLRITTVALPDGMAGQYLSTTLEAQGGRSPYLWLQTVDGIPPGLRLTPEGMIQGTPLSAGTSSFTVEVEDGSRRHVERQLTITINARPVEPPTLNPAPLPTFESKAVRQAQTEKRQPKAEPAAPASPKPPERKKIPIEEH